MRQQRRAWKRWRLRPGVMLRLDPLVGAWIVYRGRTVTLGRQPCRVKPAQGRPCETPRRRRQPRNAAAAAGGDPDCDPERRTPSVDETGGVNRLIHDGPGTTKTAGRVGFKTRIAVLHKPVALPGRGGATWHR